MRWQSILSTVHFTNLSELYYRQEGSQPDSQQSLKIHAFNLKWRWQTIKLSTSGEKGAEVVKFSELPHVNHKKLSLVDLKWTWTFKAKKEVTKAGKVQLQDSKAAVGIFSTFTEERTKISLQVLFFSRCLWSVQSGPGVDSTLRQHFAGLYHFSVHFPPTFAFNSSHRGNVLSGLSTAFPRWTSWLGSSGVSVYGDRPPPE